MPAIQQPQEREGHESAGHMWKHGHLRLEGPRWASFRGFLWPMDLSTKLWKKFSETKCPANTFYNEGDLCLLTPGLMTKLLGTGVCCFKRKRKGKREALGLQKLPLGLSYPVGFSSRSLRVVLESWPRQKPSPWWRLQITMAMEKLGLMVSSHLHRAWETSARSMRGLGPWEQMDVG